MSDEKHRGITGDSSNPKTSLSDFDDIFAEIEAEELVKKRASLNRYKEWTRSVYDPIQNSINSALQYSNKSPIRLTVNVKDPLVETNRLYQEHSRTEWADFEASAPTMHIEQRTIKPRVLRNKPVDNILLDHFNPVDATVSDFHGGIRITGKGRRDTSRVLSQGPPE